MKLRFALVSAFTGLALIGAGHTPVFAAADNDQEQNWYEVSLAVFKHKNSVTGNEKWLRPDELKLSFPAGLITLDSEEEAEVSGDEVEATTTLPRLEDLIAFQKMPASDKEFQQTLASIELSPNYDVLVTHSWRQPALDKEQALPILIQAGDEYEGYFELEGSVTLAVSRYLHIKADLWLADYIQQVDLATPWWQSDNLFEGNDYNSESTSYQPLEFNDYSNQETTTRYESVRTVVLNESRRMRSGEIHYLDHPLFGMIVKVTPVEIAEEIDEQIEEPVTISP